MSDSEFASRRTLSRRQGMRAVAGAAAGLLTAGCAAAEPPPGPTEPVDGPVELEFWAWVPGIDKIVDRWNAQRPDVRVKFVRIPAAADGGYAKLYAGLEAGVVPDLMQIEFMELPGMLLSDALVDLNRYGFRAHRHKFVDWSYAQVAFGGGVYGVPQASGPVALFYRRDVFAALGIEPPATWDEYERAAERVRRTGAYLVTFPAATPEFVPAMCWQTDSIWFGADERDWLVNVDNAGTRRVADYWQRMVERDLVATIPSDGNDWFKSLQDGQIVSAIGAQWYGEIIAGNAASTAGKWGVARLPQWDRGAPMRSGNMGGSAVSLIRGTRYPRQALEFAVWLNTDPEAVSELVAHGGGYPTLSDPSDVPAMKQRFPFFGGQRMNEVFTEASQAVDNRWKWLPTTNQALEYLITRTQEAVSSGGSFRAALADVERQVFRDLEKKGLPYRAV